MRYLHMSGRRSETKDKEGFVFCSLAPVLEPMCRSPLCILSARLPIVEVAVPGPCALCRIVCIANLSAG